jgi:hypothetical protein
LQSVIIDETDLGSGSIRRSWGFASTVSPPQLFEMALGRTVRLSQSSKHGSWVVSGMVAGRSRRAR